MMDYTTAEKVARQLRLAGTPDTLVQECTDAVNAMLAGRVELHARDEAGALVLVAGLPQPSPEAVLGATMLAARLHRRRNTTAGTDAVDGTVASYVARTDPDIARMLRLDQYAMPSVG